MALRDKVTEAMLALAPIPETQQHPERPFYYQDYANNLFCPMGEQAYQSYCAGDGEELHPKEKLIKGKQITYPPKMASIASSSALSFNLLGNDPATILDARVLPTGKYDVQYEKKMHTLRKGNKPANLDAFLSNEAGKTAIFCEMKLLEWLSAPGPLNDSYLSNRHYFPSEETAVNFPVDAYGVFHEVIKRMIGGPKTADGKHPSIFKRYDAWQMVKHLMAIYNYTSFTTKESVERFSDIPSMAGKYNRIILANVVNEFPPELIQDSRAQSVYRKALDEEHAEALQFIEIIKQSGIPRLLDNNCNSGIDVKYMSAKEFAESLDMPQTKRDYLRRYFG